MKIFKAGKALSGGVPDEDELALIRGYARGEIAPEEGYTFPVLLCDNEIDRDFERFSEETLVQLGELMLGKTGICDHEWKSGNQIARIYRTEIERDTDRLTAAGDAYVCLRGWAYMLRSEANASLIADIEGGIKKEVSIGCAVAESECSICSAKASDGDCGPIKGRTYGGKLCYLTLRGAVDAYEWSFVAVPAQRGAGVTKAFDAEKGLAGFVESECGKDFGAEFASLKADAALGREYRAALKEEVKRLSLLCGKEFYSALEADFDSMSAQTLKGLKSAFETRAAEKLPLRSQLPTAGETVRFEGDAYLV